MSDVTLVGAQENMQEIIFILQHSDLLWSGGTGWFDQGLYEFIYTKTEQEDELSAREESHKFSWEGFKDCIGRFRLGIFNFRHIFHQIMVPWDPSSLVLRVLVCLLLCGLWENAVQRGAAASAGELKKTCVLILTPISQAFTELERMGLFRLSVFPLSFPPSDVTSSL